jgi:hypothetical protein
VVRETDVAVIGGGPGGIAAAVCAARCGAEVVLVERYGYLGGLATGGIVLYLAGITDETGERQVGGLAWDLVEKLRSLGGIAENPPHKLFLDSERFKILADRVCVEAGVHLLFHSLAVGAVLTDRRVCGAILEGKSGRQAILAKICIDATGDGDLAAWSGEDFDLGRQCIGLNAMVGGVDGKRFSDFAKDHPDRLEGLREELRESGGFLLHPNLTANSDRGVYWINVRGLSGRSKTEPPDTNRKDMVGFFDGDLDALSVEDLSYAEVELRRRFWHSLVFQRRHMPGFEDAYLLSFAPQLGVRESRRIAGMHRLTRQDIEKRRSFDDTVGRAGLTFAPGGSYPIPYRCLIPQKMDGFLAAGRCISADRWMNQATRLIPASMVSGQAAGTAAAMAVSGALQPRDVEYSALRDRLRRDGAIL